MIDLSTTYLGLKLKNPLVPSASPLSEDLNKVRRLEDNGAPAIVMSSLFAEQLVREQLELHHHTEHGTESYAEALSFFPHVQEYDLGPDPYLEHIRRLKEAVDVPVIASLNGTEVGKWTEYAKHMQSAGADALELNVYYLPTDPALTGAEVEQRYIDILAAVRTQVTIPVAVKVGPFFSSMANVAQRLVATGADGLVLFNRFYQPDIDLESLEVVPNVILSAPQAMRLPLRWVAILRGQLESTSLAATSGIHTAEDCLKMLMAGADVTMMCSALLRHGPEHIATVRWSLIHWMEEHEYESVELMKGSMSHRNVEDPTGFERAQYMHALHSLK